MLLVALPSGDSTNSPILGVKLVIDRGDAAGLRPLVLLLKDRAVAKAPQAFSLSVELWLRLWHAFDSLPVHVAEDARGGAHGQPRYLRSTAQLEVGPTSGTKRTRMLGLRTPTSDHFGILDQEPISWIISSPRSRCRLSGAPRSHGHGKAAWPNCS